MCKVVPGPEPGAFFNTAHDWWLLPCTEPVAGIGHDGHLYCSWHLELIDEEPLMYFDMLDGRLTGPFYLEEDADAQRE
jgi:hypothetical protein